LAAINEAVNVVWDGAARDGADMDETVIKNTEIEEKTVAPHVRKQQQRQPKSKPILDSLTTSLQIQNCSIECIDPALDEHTLPQTYVIAEQPASRFQCQYESRA
jgi:hypothetical protein